MGGICSWNFSMLLFFLQWPSIWPELYRRAQFIYLFIFTMFQSVAFLNVLQDLHKFELINGSVWYVNWISQMPEDDKFDEYQTAY